MFHRNTLGRTLSIAAAAFALSACSVSTSHIGSLQTSNDKDFSAATTTFAPTDTIYAKADGSNIAGKVTMNWSTTAVKVAGQPANAPVPSLNKSFDLAADGDTTYTLTPSSAWPLGTYKITVTMMDDGTQRDQKSVEITVAPKGSAPAAPSDAGSSAPSDNSSDNSSNSSQ